MPQPAQDSVVCPGNQGTHRPLHSPKCASLYNESYGPEELGASCWVYTVFNNPCEDSYSCLAAFDKKGLRLGSWNPLWL